MIDWKAIDKAVAETLARHRGIQVATLIQSAQGTPQPGDVCCAKLVDCGEFEIIEYIPDMDFYFVRKTGAGESKTFYVPAFEVVILRKNSEAK